MQEAASKLWFKLIDMDKGIPEAIIAAQEGFTDNQEDMR